MTCNTSSCTSSSTTAYERRAQLTPASRSTPRCGAAVEQGARAARCAARRASPRSADGQWRVNEWLKKAVLLYFRAARQRGRARRATRASTTRCRSSTPAWERARFAAPARASCRRRVVRRGAYIAPNVVLMPSYVNIGAYVDSGTHGRHLGDGRLLRADRQERAPLRRRRHRRRARTAAGRARPSSRTTASSARARKSSRA